MSQKHVALLIDHCLLRGKRSSIFTHTFLLQTHAPLPCYSVHVFLQALFSLSIFSLDSFFSADSFKFYLCVSDFQYFTPSPDLSFKFQINMSN